MITLKTLPQATAQEVFDQVANHLLTQNKQSISNFAGGCAYRGDEGLKCAAGCLIGDDEYSEDMEGTCYSQLSLSQPDNSDLIDDLQYVHDTFVPNEWKNRLKSLADKYSLEFNHDK